MGFVSDFMSTITNAVESGAAANAAKVANAISPVCGCYWVIYCLC